MMDPKLKLDVPPQVREFAQKSVDQAERAISSFMDSATKSVAVVPGPMTDVAKHALAITEKNLKASFEHAGKLMQGQRYWRSDATPNGFSAESVWHGNRTIQGNDQRCCLRCER